MILQVPHFQFSSSPVFVNFRQNDRFSNNRFIFEKKTCHYFRPQIHSNYEKDNFATTHVKKSEKVSFSIFANFFFHFFEKKTKNLQSVK